MKILIITFIIIFCFFIFPLKANIYRYFIGRWKVKGEYCSLKGVCKKSKGRNITEFKYNNIALLSGEVCWYKIRGNKIYFVRANRTGIFTYKILNKKTIFLKLIYEKRKGKIIKNNYSVILKKIIKR